jgi:hypothetical protein
MPNRDSGRIILGVVIFLILVSFPIWYTATRGQSDYRPELEYPAGETACGSGCVSTLLALAGREDGAAAELQTRTGERISVAVRGGQLELVGSAVCVFTTDWTGDG